MSDRAYTRAQMERAKRRARHQCVTYYHIEPTPEAVGRHARTRKPCSCYMCGNPRRHHRELPFQERKALGISKRNVWS